MSAPSPHKDDPDYSPEYQDEYQCLWHLAAAQRDELARLLVELSRWSRVAEGNGDLHARIASALAMQENDGR